DVRTITMGINLMDCITDSAKRTADKEYDKIMRRAKNLVDVGNAISTEIGVPIVNKRISVTPISLITAAGKGHIEMIRALDKAASETGIDFLGGYSALVHKGMTPYEKEFIDSIPEALTQTAKICSSINVASTKAGINMDAVAMCGKIIKRAAYLTKDSDSSACTKLVIFANAVEDNPFMAGAFLGAGEADCVINVGVSGPGVVASALKQCKGDLTEVAEVIKETAFKIPRVGQLVAKEASRRLNAEFGIVDLSLAPTPAVGDSVAQILEEIGLEQVGGYGTTATLAMLNDAVKKGGTMASSHVGGLSGAFIPVSEDAGMIAAAQSGSLKLEKLEAMTAVCSVGLDMIAIPGDVSEDIISAMIADEMSIGVINCKTTAVRVIPVYGKKAGDWATFGGLLGNAPIMEVNRKSPAKFISRGGRIPAPAHSLKN
ncbi:MAG: PFL family protein, partial [Clostridia bacterium]|nr:PFL family protein [Clostridia bacterium]